MIRYILQKWYRPGWRNIYGLKEKEKERPTKSGGRTLLVKGTLYSQYLLWALVANEELLDHYHQRSGKKNITNDLALSVITRLSGNRPNRNRNHPPLIIYFNVVGILWHLISRDSVFSTSNIDRDMIQLMNANRLSSAPVRWNW